MEILELIDTREKKEVKNGYGHCEIPNCSCGSFTELSGQLPKCANCGHEFQDHY